MINLTAYDCRITFPEQFALELMGVRSATVMVSALLSSVLTNRVREKISVIFSHNIFNSIFLNIAVTRFKFHYNLFTMIHARALIQIMAWHPTGTYTE